MPSKSLYTHKAGTDEDGVRNHTLAKFDKDLNFSGTEYTLTKSQMGWVCNCPARMEVCRHVRMVGIFDLAEAGQDDLYTERSGGGLYTTFLEYDGKMFDWIRGQKLEQV